MSGNSPSLPKIRPDVRLHGPGAEVEALGDGRVGEALGHQSEDLSLTRGQRVEAAVGDFNLGRLHSSAELEIGRKGPDESYSPATSTGDNLDRPRSTLIPAAMQPPKATPSRRRFCGRHCRWSVLARKPLPGRLPGHFKRLTYPGPGDPTGTRSTNPGRQVSLDLTDRGGDARKSLQDLVVRHL